MYYYQLTIPHPRLSHPNIQTFFKQQSGVYVFVKNNSNMVKTRYMLVPITIQLESAFTLSVLLTDRDVGEFLDDLKTVNLETAA